MSTVLYEFTVPRLFGIVRTRQTNSYTPSVNYHVDCGQSFSALWPMRTAGLGAYVDTEYSDHFYCPCCGRNLDATILTAEARGLSLPVPISCTLSVIQRPGSLDLQMKYDSVLYDGDFRDISKGTKPCRTDIIRFDFRKRKSFYIRKGVSRRAIIEEIEPFFSSCDWTSTPFSHLQLNDSSYLQEHRGQLNMLVSELKRAFAEELDKRIGYKSKAIRQKAVATQGPSGALGGVLDNLVWRMVAPDAPAVTSKLINEARDTYGSSLRFKMREIIANTVSGESWVNAFMDAFEIKQSRANRRAVTKRPFFAAINIALVQQLTDNPNYAHQLSDFFAEIAHRGYSWRTHFSLDGYGIPEMIQFVKIIRANWGEKAAMQYILNGRDFRDIRDTAILYSRLNRSSRKALWAGTRIQRKNLHDYLDSKVKLQEIEDVPVQLTKRYKALEDTIEGFTFYAPESTHAIAKVGLQLNNCVRTYCGRVKEGKTAIVEVQKDGQAVACLEINPKVTNGRFAVLNQAKLKNNAPVSRNQLVKQAVTTWATMHKLEIQCARDIGV